MALLVSHQPSILQAVAEVMSSANPNSGHSYAARQYSTDGYDASGSGCYADDQSYHLNTEAQDAVQHSPARDKIRMRQIQKHQSRECSYEHLRETSASANATTRSRIAIADLIHPTFAPRKNSTVPTANFEPLSPSLQSSTSIQVPMATLTRNALFTNGTRATVETIQAMQRCIG
ncbi:hypothetical protein V1522DRAFT_394660 [Lipomyces starkeyi]